jgi:hypothetical protein
MMGPKNIIVCCDGTGNQIERNLSYVLKLFRIASKTQGQRVYYSAGIGAIGSSDAWARLRQNTKSVFALATRTRFRSDILGAYDFISRHHEEDDAIFLFGLSRGAYTVRAVAGFIHIDWVAACGPTQHRPLLRCAPTSKPATMMISAWHRISQRLPEVVRCGSNCWSLGYRCLGPRAPRRPHHSPTSHLTVHAEESKRRRLSPRDCDR